MHHFGGTVYLLANNAHLVLYLGVTSDLAVRVFEHKSKKYADSFSAKYNCCKLVWYESFSRIESAIAKEKQMKKWKREWKENLINSFNPEWTDLYESLFKD